MAMDAERHVSLRIPEPEDFAMTPPIAYVPVPSSVVDFGIDLLQCVVAQWKMDEGSEPQKEVWDRLVVAAAQMLSGLLSAWATYYHHDDARPLIDQIARFCARFPLYPTAGGGARAALLAVRTEPLAPRAHVVDAPEGAHIVDALLALHEESARKRQERKERKEGGQP